jgi:hypothetical protein
MNVKVNHLPRSQSYSAAGKAPLRLPSSPDNTLQPAMMVDQQRAPLARTISSCLIPAEMESPANWEPVPAKSY